MQIKYSVSLWNFLHYADVPRLERIITFLHEQGYGIELWKSWKEAKDLFEEAIRRRLKYALKSMRVSFHTAGADTFDLHKKQIDAAMDLGAEVIVLHPDDLTSKSNSGLDVKLANKIVAYSAKHGIKLALENGIKDQDLFFLITAIERVEGLGICLDVGHVYLTSHPINKFLDSLKERIIHLHIQDILPKTEAALPYTSKEHYIPGTGRIPPKDWKLLATTLKEIDFRGTAVFEIRPRNPFQTAFLGKIFMEKLLEKS